MGGGRGVQPPRETVWTRRNVGFAAATVVAASGYYLLWSRSGALTPASAPWFYRPDVSVARLLSNGPEYLDRSATFPAVVLVVFWLVNRRALTSAVNPDRRLACFAAIWWISGFAITIFLPVRSSLYACSPSIGVAILVAATLARSWHGLDDRRRDVTLAVGLAIPFVLWPVYHARNKDLVIAAELSARTLVALQSIATHHGAGTVVVLRDDRARRISLASAFGNALQDAVNLVVKPSVFAWIDPPPPEAADGGLTPPPSRPDVTLSLRNGELVPAFEPRRDHRRAPEAPPVTHSNEEVIR